MFGPILELRASGSNPNAGPWLIAVPSVLQSVGEFGPPIDNFCALQFWHQLLEQSKVSSRFFLGHIPQVAMVEVFELLALEEGSE